ncbi:MAG TPA: DUF2914 domain-containing protein [Candidatus Paceibacterota bacterium]|nr:DUF2914 domain-containing protein [Candidatus Paceibacterota bacterium]
MESLEEFFLIKHVKNWYLRFERPISSLSLVGGFIFDIFALNRVDEPLENFWVGVHLCVAALGILLLNLLENGRMKALLRDKARSVFHFWLVMLTQFGFGGLLSTFLVFYFRSATLAASWPFLVLLAAAFILNEALKYHYARLTFQISMLFLSTYSFAIYIVPVIVHRVGDDVFLLSGAVTLAFIALFLAAMRLLTREHFRENRKLIALLIVGLTALVNGLYFLNVIPPIPLSLKSGGIYHSVAHSIDGSYALGAEASSWLDYFLPSQSIHTTPGETVYAWSAVFSPTSLNTTIVHVWQYYDDTAGKWVTESRVPLSVTGGRGGGYRTYSTRSSLTPGKWRVNVENLSGQIIGRLSFTVEQGIVPPALHTVVE